jgi:iron complex outermembrane receptor protein
LVPEYDAMLAARYEFGAGFFSRVEVGFTGETELDERNRATQPSVETYNLQLGYEGHSLSIRLFGENLTDERRFSGLGFDNLGFGADGNFYAPLDAPRIVGIEFESRF